MLIWCVDRTSWPECLWHCLTPSTCSHRCCGTCSTEKWRCRTVCRLCSAATHSALRSWPSASRSTELAICRVYWSLWCGHSSRTRHPVSRWILPGWFLVSWTLLIFLALKSLNFQLTVTNQILFQTLMLIILTCLCFKRGISKLTHILQLVMVSNILVHSFAFL